MDAVSVKDGLWSSLTQADSRNALMTAINNLLIVLKFTKGFWAELGYAYKAVELCELAIRQSERFHGSPATTKEHEMLATVIVDLSKISKEYQALKVEAWQGYS